MTPGAGEDMPVKEGDPVSITCKPGEMGSLVVWFRVLDPGMQFLASFSSNGVLKSSTGSFSSIFSDTNIRENILTLKKFSKTRDSGVYSCASLIKGNELNFGNLIRLVGDKVSVEEVAKATITPPNECTTATPCNCNKNEKINQGETSLQMYCSTIILGPLAGGCGFLLLLLIIITVYCNKIRTRRCPHHHKRKPRVPTPGKQMTNLRPV
ncbi:T-cell surface glycoprotein CD8 alpha chain isoform X2 [Anoplopoma fimbria]|nr:T-cell surface glycoprotein CD8 alpha chain isoform X2 [Anoplopoma fimbria]